MTLDDLILALCLIIPAVLGELLFLFLWFRQRRQRPNKQNWPEILGFNLVSLFILVTLALLGGEFYYRFIYDTTDAMACTRVSQRWVERYAKLNDAGFRDDARYRASIAPGLRRISFLGDSFTAGHGIKRNADRFPDLIRAAHPEWEIHLLAKPGSDTGGEIKRLQELRVVNYRLDCVVLVYCLNDVADLFPEWTATIDRIYTDPKQRPWLTQHSYFLDLLYNRYRLAREPLTKDYYEFVREGYRDAVWEKQKERLTDLHAHVKADGGKLIVVTFPFLHKLGADYEYRSAHEKLNRFWSELGVPHLDLLPAFTNQSPEKLVVNRNDPHPNETAHRIAAGEIEAFLKANLGGEK